MPSHDRYCCSVVVREQLLKVLLKVVSGVLSTTPPKRKENSLGGRLSQHLFQVGVTSQLQFCLICSQFGTCVFVLCMLNACCLVHCLSTHMLAF